MDIPVAVDSSVLIAWERSGSLPDFLSAYESAYVPAHAAAEFLLGTHPPVSAIYRDRARRLYEHGIRHLVSAFNEADAASLAALAADLRAKGRTMPWFDAAIAATALARGDELLTADSDFDRLKGKLKVLKYTPG